MRILVPFLLVIAIFVGGPNTIVPEAKAQCANATKCLSTRVRTDNSYYRLDARNTCGKSVRACACWQRRNGSYTNCGCETINSKGDFWATQGGNTGRVRFGAVFRGCGVNIIRAFRLRR